MSLLIGLGIFAGVALAVAIVVMVSWAVAGSDRALVVLGVVFLLSIANLIGWGLLHNTGGMPLWVWLPPATCVVLILGVVVLADDGGW